MKRKIIWSFALLACLCCLPSAKTKAQTKNAAIIPGEVWKDTDGNPINAHGGGLLYHEGTYYWYGEYKKGETILPEWATWECYRTDVTGVSCYSSKDLLNWKFEGIVLPAVKDDEKHDLHPSKVLERPKVIYNEKTKKFVMWAHVESADYSKACAGVAVSDSPTGTFTYVGSFRPNGAMSRDQTVFIDDNGGAGFIFHLQIEANRGIGQYRRQGRQQPGRQTVGVDRQRQQQRRGAGLLIAQPLLFQQLHLTKQGQQLLSLLRRTRRNGTDQQRLSEHILKLLDALRITASSACSVL